VLAHPTIAGANDDFWASHEVVQDPRSFLMPPEQLIESRLSLEDVCGEVIQNLLNGILPSIGILGPMSCQSLVDSFAMQPANLIRSSNSLVYLAVFLQIFKTIVGHTAMTDLTPLLVNDTIFSPSENLFRIAGLSPVRNTMPNEVLDFVATHDLGLSELFVRTAATPLLFGELLLRATRYHPLSDDVFGREMVMAALISASLGIQQLTSDPDVPGTGYAKSIIFKTLFGLLDDRVTAQRCFESQIFATGFLSLMFEPLLRQLSCSRCRVVCRRWQRCPIPSRCFCCQCSSLARFIITINNLH
jgi:hypothetical protein